MVVPLLADVGGAEKLLAGVLQLCAGVPQLLGASGAVSSGGHGGKREGRDSSSSWKDGLWHLKHLFARDAGLVLVGGGLGALWWLLLEGLRFK